MFDPKSKLVNFFSDEIEFKLSLRKEDNIYKRKLPENQKEYKYTQIKLNY